jgi:hypothetical protein
MLGTWQVGGDRLFARSVHVPEMADCSATPSAYSFAFSADCNELALYGVAGATCSAQAVVLDGLQARRE